MARRLPHGSRALAVVALLLTPFAIGCGGSGNGNGGTASSGGGPDPASVAPASVAVYFQATVRPSGQMKDDVLAAARKVLRVRDPGAELRRLLDGDRSGGVVFSRDVEPWLGQRSGGFLLLPTGGARKPDFGVALAIADRGAFDGAHARLLRHDLHHAGSYRSVALDQEGRDRTSWFAPVGDFYVGGTLGGVRAAIDASKGSSLADAARFTDAVGRVPANALAFAYADPKAIAAGLRRSLGSSSAARRTLAKLSTADPATASLTATADEIALEANADATLTGATSGGSDAQVSIGQMPGDAWLALATPPIGPLGREALDVSGMHDRAAAQVRRNLGLDLDRDLLGPLGGLGLFVRGGSPLDVGGGVLLRMTDAAAAQRLLTRIEAVVAGGAHLPLHLVTLSGARGFQVQIPQSPQPIVVLAEGDKLAVGYAASSAQDLLRPQQRFDDSSAGKAAIATLGAGYAPSFALLVPQLAGLLRSLDELQVANLSSVLPYVTPYRSLAIGTKRDGDRIAMRVVAALR
jgi:hypothetical protein